MLFLILFCFSPFQDTSPSRITNDHIYKSLINLDFQEFDQLSSGYAREESHDLVLLRDLIYYGGQETHSFDYRVIDSLSNPCLADLITGYDLMYHQDVPVDAYRLLQQAYDCSVGTDDSSFKKVCILALLEYYQLDYNQTDEDYTELLEEYRLLSDSPSDDFWVTMHTIMLRNKSIDKSKWNNPELMDSMLYAMEQLPDQSNLKLFGKSTYALHSEVTNEKNKAEKLYKSLLLDISNDKPYATRIKNRAYFRLAEIMRGKREYHKALGFIKKAEANGDRIDTLRYKMYVNYFASRSNHELGNHDLAYDQLFNTLQIEGKLALNEAAISTSVLRTRLNTLETENELLTKKNENNQLQSSLTENNLRLNRNRILLGFSLLGIGFISYFYYTNRRNNRLKEKLLKTELANTQKESVLQSQAARIIGQEKERKRIANILHDQVAGNLSAAKFQLSSMKMGKQQLALPLDLIQQSGEQIRDLSHDLYPPILLQEGLVGAVRDLIYKYQSDSLNITLDTNLEDIVLPSETIAYEIILELVNNVIKHSGGTLCSIILKLSPTHLDISVSDNGKGIDSDIKNSFGLTKIKHHVESLQGSIQYRNASLGGLEVQILIPVFQSSI